jgi:hypothetical protein
MRLLADRRSGGINVRLFWDETAAPGDDIVIRYEDRSEGVSFRFNPPPDRALDAFYHPNAYLSLAPARAA